MPQDWPKKWQKDKKKKKKKKTENDLQTILRENNINKHPDA